MTDEDVMMMLEEAAELLHEATDDDIIEAYGRILGIKALLKMRLKHNER